MQAIQQYSFSIIWAVILLMPSPAFCQSDATRKVFANSVAPLTSTGLTVQTWGAAPDSNDTMKLLFSLEIPAEATADLQKRIDKGEIISPKEYLEKYSAPQKGYDDLTKWLKENDFQVTRTSPDRTSVYARSTVANVEKTLKVNIVKVTTKGVTYNAAKNAPSLPADVGASVHAIIGLQPFRQAKKQAILLAPTPASTGTLSASEQPPAPNPAIANKPPYLVKEILKAYNAQSLGVTGKGQTIAILIDTFPDQADLKAFWHANGLAVDISQIEKIPPTGPLPARAKRRWMSSGRAASLRARRFASTQVGR